MSRLAAITFALVLAGAASAYADPGDRNEDGHHQFEPGEGGRPGRAREGGDHPAHQGGEQHGMPARPAPNAAPAPQAPQNNGAHYSGQNNGSQNGGQNNAAQNNGGPDRRYGGNRDAWRGRENAPQGSPGQFAYRNNGAPNTGPNTSQVNGFAPRPGDGPNTYAARGGPGYRGGPGDNRGTDRGRDNNRDNNYASNDHRDPRFDSGRGYQGRPGEGHDFRDRDRGRAWYSPRIYQPYYHAQYRYRIAPYRYPYGWFVRTWYYGEYLPNAWYTPTYYLDWRAYGLDYPPIGCEWVRVGNNALLVDIYTGEILSIYYDLFW